MPKHIYQRLILIAAFIIVTTQSRAHVPYFEHNDFSAEHPFKVEYSIEQSLAIYAYLDNNDIKDPPDIDVFVFRIKEPTSVYIEALVPVCPGYEDFQPWFALAGPGLSAPKAPLPFDIPKGYGIEVIQNVTTGEMRDTFYEFFGAKSYYKGPVFDEYLTVPGTYYIYFWDPQEESGDYVAVLGRKEVWRFQDIIQALRNTPLIRLGAELHVDCAEQNLEDTQELGPSTR